MYVSKMYVLGHVHSRIKTTMEGKLSQGNSYLNFTCPYVGMSRNHF